MRRLALLVALNASCFYDFNNPVKDVTVGEIRGVAMREEPGTGKKIPATGAEVLVKGTSVSVVTDDKGRFRIFNLPPTPEGEFYTVVLRYSTTGTKVFDLVTLKKGIKLAADDGVNLGEITVEKTGTISGFARRFDQDQTSDLHGGTFVGVPGTAFATTTFRDGFYAIPLLAGDLYELAAWRPGYTLLRIEKLLTPGDNAAVAEVVKLPLQTGTEEATISGTILLAGPQSDVELRLVEGGVVQTLPSSGRFTMQAPMGSYTLLVKSTGYQEVYITNVVADPAAETYEVGMVTLFQSGGDADRDGIADTDDPDDDNDGTSDQDEPGCDAYPEPGRAYACLNVPFCRPILSAGGTAVPVAVAGCDILATPSGRDVFVDGTRSFDPAGAALTYTWRVVSPTNTSLYAVLSPFDAPVFQIRPLFPQADPYKIELVVDNGKAVSMPATTTIQVDDTNAAPVFDNTDPIFYFMAASTFSSSLQVPPARDPDSRGGALSYAWVPRNVYDRRGYPGALPLRGEPSASTQKPLLGVKPPVGTSEWVVFAIDERGAFSLPKFVAATFLESDLAGSVFVNPMRDDSAQCTCLINRGTGTPDDPYCDLQNALVDTQSTRKDIYIGQTCFTGAAVVNGPISCVEGRSLYGGFSVGQDGNGNKYWIRDPEAYRTEIAPTAGLNETIRCAGTSEQITPATVIDGMNINGPASQPALPQCQAVQTLLIIDHASPTISNNHFPYTAGVTSLIDNFIFINVKYASSPVIFNNVIGGNAIGATPRNAMTGIRMADGANAIIAHNVIDIPSNSGGAGAGTFGMASTSQGCGNPVDRCVATQCTNATGVFCASDLDCSFPSRPVVMNNVIMVLGGANRYGYGEFGLGSSPTAFEANFIHLVDGSTAPKVAYVNGGTTFAPPLFGGGTLLNLENDVNALPEARGTASNKLGNPQLGANCAVCPSPFSPVIDAGRPAAGIPNLFLDHLGSLRPNPGTRPDIGAVEFYDIGF